MSWIIFTILATILQTFRTLEQKTLNKKLDLLTVSWSRFILPFPIALGFVLYEPVANLTSKKIQTKKIWFKTFRNFLLGFFGIFLIFSAFWFAVLVIFGCFLVFRRSFPLFRLLAVEMA